MWFFTIRFQTNIEYLALKAQTKAAHRPRWLARLPTTVSMLVERSCTAHIIELKTAGQPSCIVANKGLQSLQNLFMSKASGIFQIAK